METDVQDDEAPSPGSPLAVMRGCRCPIIDNAHGAGPGASGEFWISESCPLHGRAAPQAPPCSPAE